MKKFTLIVLLLMSFITLFSQTFIIGVENIDYYPHYAWSDGEYKGFGREVLDAFAKSKGYTFEYRALPIARLFTNLVDGKVDFKYPDNSYWSADLKKGKNVIYSAEVILYTDGVFVKKENVNKPISAIKTLGIVQGFTPWDYLGYIKSGQIKSTENSDFDKMILQALSNRVDVAYGNISVLNYHLDTILKKKGEMVFMESYPHTKSFYHLSTTKHKDVIAEFNQFLQENKELVEQLKRKFQLN